MIRPVTPDDAEALARVDANVVADGRGMLRRPGESAPAEDFADRVRRYARHPTGGTFLVVDVDGVAVGEGTIRRVGVSFCPHVALVAVQVDPAHQGRGHGRALVEALVAFGDAHGFERQELRVIADNHRAVRLYRSVGFSEVLRRPDYVRRPDGTRADDLEMVRISRPARVEKVAAAIVRTDRGKPELCVFAHPSAGWQLPKGTVEAREALVDAVLREVEEETGLTGCRAEALGSWMVETRGQGDHRWHGFRVRPPATVRDRWEHQARGSAEEEGLRFDLRWVPLPFALEVLPPVFHEVVHRAADLGP